VTWQDDRNGYADIYFNYSSDYGANWQETDIRLDTDNPFIGSSYGPKISSDGNGHVYVTWQDDRNGNWDIYFSSYSIDIIQNIIDNVESYIGDKLTQEQADELIAIMEDCIKHLDMDKTKTACNDLNSFANEINGLIKDGTLTQEEADALIGAVENMQAKLGCKTK
jgi:hypothetical protein